MALFENTDAGSEQEVWNKIRAMAADTFEASPLRAASSLELAKLAVVLHEEDILKLELPTDLTIHEMVQALRAMDTKEWTEDLHVFCSEFHVVQKQLRRDEPTETAGGITEAVPDDDVGLRQGTLESMHNQVNEC